MPVAPTAICRPDLTERPFSLSLQRWFSPAPPHLFAAWTQHIDAWLAIPGSVLVRAEVNVPFFFETISRTDAGRPAQRHPHYGRFLRLEADRLIELAWVSGANGTEGAETILTVDLQPRDGGTLLRLTHAGFPNAAAQRRHEEAWPIVLEQLEGTLGDAAFRDSDLSQDIANGFDDDDTTGETCAPVKWDELDMAFDFVSSAPPMENEAYISPATGAIQYHSTWGGDEPEEMATDDNAIAIPHKNDLDLGRTLVLQFADRMLPAQYDRIADFFRRKGAYGRLKGLLADEGLLEQWYAFEAEAQEKALRAWCAANGIPIQEGKDEPGQ